MGYGKLGPRLKNDNCGCFGGGETQALTTFSQSINGGLVNLQGTCDLCERFGRFFLLPGSYMKPSGQKGCFGQG